MCLTAELSGILPVNHNVEKNLRLLLCFVDEIKHYWPPDIYWQMKALKKSHFKYLFWENYDKCFLQFSSKLRKLLFFSVLLSLFWIGQGLWLFEASDEFPKDYFPLDGWNFKLEMCTDSTGGSCCPWRPLPQRGGISVSGWVQCFPVIQSGKILVSRKLAGLTANKAR